MHDLTFLVSESHTNSYICMAAKRVCYIKKKKIMRAMKKYISPFKKKNSGPNSKCPGHLESPPLAPPVIVIALRDKVLVAIVLLATYALLLSDTETKGPPAVSVSNLYRDMHVYNNAHAL